ncbi:MAG: aminotransferase class I/II-fold pyridoxal phosphate-dependent enzyme [Candidatus Zixiibacteriota bacterium]
MGWPRQLSPAGTRITFGDLCATLFASIFLPNQYRKLRNEVSSHFGARHVYLTGSGRGALTVILTSLANEDKRREVIIPAYTCFSVPSAVKAAGYKVRLVDLDRNGYDYDLAKLEQAIGPTTRAILLVYPFGLGCNIEAVQNLARSKGVLLIEDVAQSMGLQCRGKCAGMHGDFGFFSLSKGKAITSIRGGIIITNDDAHAALLGKTVEALPSPGILANLKLMIEVKVIWLFLRPTLFWLIGALPFIRLGETHYDPTMRPTQMHRTAAVLCRRMLARLDQTNRERAAAARNILSQLQTSEATMPMTGISPEHSTFLRLPILCSNEELRDHLFATLQKCGASRMYNSTLAVIQDRELFAGSQPDESSYPNAVRVARCLVTLPTHAYVTSRDRSEIVQALKSTQSAVGSRTNG